MEVAGSIAQLTGTITGGLHLASYTSINLSSLSFVCLFDNASKSPTDDIMENRMLTTEKLQIKYIYFIPEGSIHMEMVRNMVFRNI